MDLVRPLGLAGVEVAVVAVSGAPTRFSRFVRAVIEADETQQTGEQVVEQLIRFAAGQSSKPILFYDSDAALSIISQYAGRLREHFAFVIPPSTLVEDLVDKSRFQLIAERLGLPVPPTQELVPGPATGAPDVKLRYPIVVKPVSRADHFRWEAFQARGKAHRVQSADAFREIWPRLGATGARVIAQELITGHERQIFSFHAYVDADGRIAAHFVGRKIRTFPREYGDTSALTITADPEVAESGIDILRRLDFRGVAKLDFKRGPDGRLHLLEINPRFNLWHHPGAITGVNIPAFVYADLTGRPRPRSEPARVGTTWFKAWRDPVAARQDGMSLVAWLRWAMRADSTAVLAWDDPMPFVRGMAWTRARRRLGIEGAETALTKRRADGTGTP